MSAHRWPYLAWLVLSVLLNTAGLAGAAEGPTANKPNTSPKLSTATATNKPATTEKPKAANKNS